MNAGMFSSQFCHTPPSPCRKSSGAPSPPVSTTFRRRPATTMARVSAGQSTLRHVESSPSAYSGSAPGRMNALPAKPRTCSLNPGTPLPYPRHVKQLSAPADHRAYLPAVEPERQVTDWGRSERGEGLMDRTVYDFLYHYWFRVEVEGIEHVPSTGGALLVSNHAGALPPDASMIAKAIKEEHSRPRPLHMTVEHFFKGYPWLSMLVPKIGGVPAHPANVHRLLYDEEQLVLVFPEGAKGTEKLYKDRYRLLGFGPGGVVAGGAHPISPPLPLKRLTGLLYAPLAPLVYLPAKFFIRFLEPIPTDVYGEEPWQDAGLVQSVAEEVGARIQEELYEMLARRLSAWLG